MLGMTESVGHGQTLKLILNYSDFRHNIYILDHSWFSYRSYIDIGALEFTSTQNTQCNIFTDTHTHHIHTHTPHTHTHTHIYIYIYFIYILYISYLTIFLRCK
jgi:hypothetical protein